ncbi:hypothetical protein F1880_001234, partial [Penicillium rolfsii]
PSCAQCSNEPSKCVYPESGKRGLPLGYLNQLEQRLSETEAALYSALVTLRAMRPTTVAHASVKPESIHKQKAARMDEWNQLPLRGWSDMGHWLTAMSHQFTLEHPQTPDAHFTEPSEGGLIIPQSPNYPSHGNIHSSSVNMDAGDASTSHAWPPRRVISVESPLETHLRPQAMVSSPLYSRGQATGVSDGVASLAGRVQGYDNVTMSGESGPLGSARPVENGPASRAEELSKNRPSIYF